MDRDDEVVRRCCSVPECKATAPEDRVFHKLPELEEMRQEWIQVCNITANDDGDVFICDSHFCMEDYEPDMDSTLQRLRQTAIPSQNLPPQFEEYIPPEEMEKTEDTPSLLKNNSKLQRVEEVITIFQNAEEHRRKRKRKPKLLPNEFENGSNKIEKLDEASVQSVSQKRKIIKIIPTVIKRPCCVPECTATSEDKRSYHRFPKVKKIRQKWIAACKLDKTVKPYFCVCSAHFQKDDYLTGPNSRRQILKSIAVPSLNLPSHGGMKLVISESTNTEMKSSKNTKSSEQEEKPKTFIYVPASGKKIITKNAANVKLDFVKNSDPNIIIKKLDTAHVIHLDSNPADSDQKESDPKTKHRNSGNVKNLGSKNVTEQCNVIILKPNIFQNQKNISKKVIVKKQESENININKNSINSNKRTFAITLCAGCGQYCKIKDDDLLDIGKKNIETLTAETLLELQEISPSNEDECTLLTNKGIEICDKVLQNQNINLMDMLTTDNELIAFTGINFELLNKLTKLITLFEGNSAKEQPLDTKNRIVMCLCKLRTNLPFRCLAMLFGIAHQLYTQCFFTMIRTLAVLMEKTIYWTPTEELLKSVPKNLHSFKQTRAVLSSNETDIEKQRCEKCQQEFASSNKGQETIKLILGVAPSGLIIFKSKVFETQTSDTSIFNRTNILEHLDPVRDAILTDKSLNIEAECAERNIALIKLPKLEKNKYFNKNDVEHIKNITATRIHADRTLHRFKMYNIMRNKISWRILPFVDDICTVIAGIVNMKNPTPPDESRFKLSELIYK